MAPSNPLVRDKAYVGGEWVAAKSGATFAVLNPATGETIVDIADAGAADTAVAIDKAHEAFMTWKKTTATERAAILTKFAKLMEDNAEDLAKIITAENGKKLAEARNEAHGAAEFLDYFAAEATRTQGDILVPRDRSRRQLVIRQPIGVAGLITPERAAILTKFAKLMEDNAEDLAKIITAENGKKLAEARNEAHGAAEFLDYFAAEATRTQGDILVPRDRSRRQLVIRQPIGVAGLITPWNFPMKMITRKAGAALAAGCTVVIKPSEDTPLSALALCDFAKEAGVPDGVFNIVPCSRANAPAVGKVLCESLLVSKISFTGSTATGKILFAQSASTVKKVSLEMGGNSPLIVFDSANVDAAVMGAFALKYYGAGQKCVSPNRILVQEGVYAEFCEKFAKYASSLVPGDGMDPKTTLGPLINQRGLEKVERHVDDAVSKGGKLLTGGKRADLGGNFFQPTVVADIPTSALVCSEETFGPLASILKFKTEEEALTIANNTRMGLAGYFFSQNISQIWRVAEEMEVGLVGINDTFPVGTDLPFGGIKESGIGIEGSKYALHEFQNVKVLGFAGL